MLRLRTDAKPRPERSVNIQTPVDAIRASMKEKDLKPRDLIPFIGNQTAVSQVLSGKHGLTLDNDHGAS